MNEQVVKNLHPRDLDLDQSSSLNDKSPIDMRTLINQRFVDEPSQVEAYKHQASSNNVQKLKDNISIFDKIQMRLSNLQP